ncbi:MAG: molybdopterin-guanine dinucleotide biosynthesis protein A [Cyclobacteriaceae bacterium]|jgi:molybdopterin-guanine dinucleotide biosynthesis protein A
MLNALILIGGKSTRLGEDKYMMEVNGKPQYQHLYDLMHGMNIPTYLSCNEKQDQILSKTYPSIVDQYPDSGPIGGIVSAMNFRSNVSWLVTACDLVNLTADAISNLISENQEGFDIVTYQQESSEFLETTLSIYNPSSSRALLQAINSGNLRLQNVLKGCNTHVIKVSDGNFLKNVNSPKDLKRS